MVKGEKTVMASRPAVLSYLLRLIIYVRQPAKKSQVLLSQRLTDENAARIDATPYAVTTYENFEIFPFFLKLGLTNADNNSIMEEQDRHAVSQAVSPTPGPSVKQ